MGLAKSGDVASRFSAYVEGLTSVIGHADRAKPLRDYCTGLMMPCDRKSVEQRRSQPDADIGSDPSAAIVLHVLRKPLIAVVVHAVGAACALDGYVLPFRAEVDDAGFSAARPFAVNTILCRPYCLAFGGSAINSARAGAHKIPVHPGSCSLDPSSGIGQPA